MRYYFFVITVCLGLTGCKSTPPPKKIKPQTFVNVPITVAGTGIPSDSQEKYLLNPRVVGYSVGRLVTGNGSTMHERHNVYRIVSDSKWNLTPQPNADPMAISMKNAQKRRASALLGQMARALNELHEGEKRINKAIALNNQGEERSKSIDAKIKKLYNRQKVMIDNVKSIAQTFRIVNEKVNKVEKKLNKELEHKALSPQNRWKK